MISMRRYCYVNIVGTSTDFDVRPDLAPIRPDYSSAVFTSTKLNSVMFGVTTCSLPGRLSVVHKCWRNFVGGGGHSRLIKTVINLNELQYLSHITSNRESSLLNSAILDFI
jgi:hypothetical protein